ncbi:MAG: phosphatase PAP2 family protein [Gammaproteobacteria bacterium]|nr:phosphatase PAP2 family protein [Gammaproteobacteria bacterium]
MTRQWALTALALIFTVLLFNALDIDLWLQDHFYNAELQQWILEKDQKTARLIFYDGIKRVYIVFAVALVVALVFFRNHARIQAYRQGLLIVLLSSLVVPLVVGGLKSITNIPCPRHITHYNGSYPYVTLLKSYPANFEAKEAVRCFPAAHASGGFALLALFFLFKTRRHKIMGLTAAMTLGWSTGTYKMLIGDHFLSHTLVTMLLAWLIILAIARMIYSTNIFPVTPQEHE